MSLNADLQVLLGELTAKAPPELIARFSEGINEVIASNADQAALNIGDDLPNIIAPDLESRTHHIADALRHGPVVLLFFRGGWCPFCNLQIRAMSLAYPRIAATKASLYALTPELPDSAMSTLGTEPVPFPILFDRSNAIARSFGLVFRLNEALRHVHEALGTPLPKLNGDMSWELPIPAVYVADPKGHIAWRHLDADYRKRTEPNDILNALRELKHN